MRVGIMAGVYWPEAGGSATYLHSLRRDLEAAGHDVKVLCYGEEPSEPRIIRVSRRLPIPLRLLVFAYWAARWLRDRDVWFVNEYGLVATILRPFLRKPTLMKIVGDWAWESAVNQGLVAMSPLDAQGRFHDPLVELESRRQPLRVEARKFIRRLAARRMDRILVPSRYLKTIVAGWGLPAQRIEVIYNGMIQSQPTAAAGTGRTAGLIVTVARLVSWKGIDHLIHAAAELARDRPNVRLLVLGDGPDRVRLEAIAAEVAPSLTTFAGHVDRAEVHRQLARAEIFVLASAYEGLPHVVLEALAEGCAVVVAGAGGTTEVIRDGIDGLVVPYGDPPSLAAALARLVDDDDLRKGFSAAGPERVRTAFSWESTSRDAIALLADVAAAGRAT